MLAMRYTTPMTERPVAPACERNRDPILAVLRTAFADRREALEIGSGTGQHAVYFAAAMPALRWQCTDRAPQLPGIRAWLDVAALPNTPPPCELDVAAVPWPRSGAADGRYDAVFSANTLHIMGWAEVRACFAALPGVLADEATVAIYGPFNVDGAFTSDSNRAFDASLKRRDPAMGLRDQADVDALARAAGLALVRDVEMPANNRCLVWRRQRGRPG